MCKMKLKCKRCGTLLKKQKDNYLAISAIPKNLGISYQGRYKCPKCYQKDM